MEYFSDIENGPKPRTDETISPAAWGGIVALIKSLISSGAFGLKYPELCPDGNIIIGNNEQNLALAVQSEILIEWPLITVRKKEGGYPWDEEPYVPETLAALDLIQFCYNASAKPEQGDYLSYYRHYHLNYDEVSGKEEFRESINKIFARNGIAYTLCEDGNIKHLIPEIMREQISPDFWTGDSTLDGMLADAKKKFLNPKPEIRKEAVERLWDCWERLKTIDNPSDKRSSVKTLLDKAASVSEIRSLLEDEARVLTDIGNKFQIRHTETDKINITDSEIIDYLFYRMFAMIHLLIKKRTSTVGPSTTVGTTG